MKKIVYFLLGTLLLTSCATKTNERKKLYDKHLRSLVESKVENMGDNAGPFKITGRYLPRVIEEKNVFQLELIFDQADFVMEDITILLIDARQINYKQSPLNVGYFNDEKMNFADSKTEITETTHQAYRYNWYSDSSDVTMKIIFTYQNDADRIEYRSIFKDFKLFVEQEQ